MSYTFTLLTTSDSIGDTLSAINQNYSTLEAWADSIQLSADNYWFPFIEFYKNFNLELKPNIVNSNVMLEKWKAAATLVESNSSKWLEPLILYYPYLIEESNQIVGTIPDINPATLNAITGWLNSNFPVLSVNCYNGVCYMERQESIIHLILKSSRVDSEKYQVSDSTVCSTTNTIASGPCVINLTGNVLGCNRKSYVCGGKVSCNITQQVECTFPDGAKSNNRSITANLNYDFIDTYENKNILRLKYSVSNCSWIFISKA
jgi:hypothetical protein